MYKISNKARCLSDELKGRKVIEITFDWYYNVLEGVPPLEQHPDWFICGEPYGNDVNGCLTYTHFLHFNGHYYAFAAMTPTTMGRLIDILHEANNS